MTIQELNQERQELALANAKTNEVIGMTKITNTGIRNKAEARVYLDEEFSGLKNAEQRTATVKSILTAEGYYLNESAILKLERDIAENDARIQFITTEIQYTGGAN